MGVLPASVRRYCGDGFTGVGSVELGVALLSLSAGFGVLGVLVFFDFFDFFLVLVPEALLPLEELLAPLIELELEPAEGLIR